MQRRTGMRGTTTMQTRLVAWLGLIWLFATAIFGAPGCSDNARRANNGGNSETHFLRSCSGTCDGGLTCLCGVCTRACDAANTCSPLASAAQCMACEGVSASVCDVTCQGNAECSALGAGFRCLGGRCREAEQGTGGNGSGGSSSVGTGGTAALCNGTPTENPVRVPPTQLDADQVALTATIVGSCLSDDGVDRNSAHIWEADLGTPYFFMRTAQQAECLVNARCGCAAVRHCLGIRYGRVGETCTTGCTGGVFKGCGPEFDLEAGYFYEVDCARVGLACDPTGVCVDGPAVSCAAGSPLTCNQAGEAEVCERELVRRSPACSNLGLDCGASGCVGRGADCSGDSLEASQVIFVGLGCEGTNLRSCVNGKESTVDCAGRGPGFGCQTVAGTSFCGLANECVPAGHYAHSASHPARCDGNVLTFCNAGRLEHVDCTTLGFTGCALDTSIPAYGCIPGPSL